MKNILLIVTVLALTACSATGPKDANELKASPCACVELRNHANDA